MTEQLHYKLAWGAQATERVSPVFVFKARLSLCAHLNYGHKRQSCIVTRSHPPTHRHVRLFQENEME